MVDFNRLLAGAGGIGTTLQGVGAALGGRAMEFERQQELMRQQRLEEERVKQREVEKARAIDSAVMLDHLKAGRIDQAQQFMDNRIGTLIDMNIDPTDSIAALNMLQAGQVEPVMGVLEDQVKQGRLRGDLPEAEEVKAVIPEVISETEDKTRVNIQDPVTGQVRQVPIEGAIAPTPEPVTPGLEFKDLRSVNKDVGDLIKDTVNIRNAATSLSKISQTKSATDQLAAIFTFMKSLDPTSVVREGEQDQARATGGLADSMIGFVNRIQGEGGLPPKVFEQMVATAKSLTNQAIENSQTDVTNFLSPFEGQLKQENRDKLMRRIPKKFDIPLSAAEQEELRALEAEFGRQ